ncbi:hypothetical protein NECAME_17159 [Necator americanus]|uniref:Uncharacterized protein n=1 Tax=Necator americanus TaxID=51031 RepID=W2TT96_NECAM|nr:hypothetical protein NECAME_17159 [Necator americanus]ETN84326.1 hypothetical protein NECAME_17159 [Necator americanus]
MVRPLEKRRKRLCNARQRSASIGRPKNRATQRNGQNMTCSPASLSTRLLVDLCGRNCRRQALTFAMNSQSLAAPGDHEKALENFLGYLIRFVMTNQLSSSNHE